LAVEQTDEADRPEQRMSLCLNQVAVRRLILHVIEPSRHARGKPAQVVDPSRLMENVARGPDGRRRAGTLFGTS